MTIIRCSSIFFFLLFCIELFLMSSTSLDFTVFILCMSLILLLILLALMLLYQLNFPLCGMDKGLSHFTLNL